MKLHASCGMHSIPGATVAVSLRFRVLQGLYLRTVLHKGNQYLSAVLAKYPAPLPVPSPSMATFSPTMTLPCIAPWMTVPSLGPRHESGLLQHESTPPQHWLSASGGSFILVGSCVHSCYPMFTAVCLSAFVSRLLCSVCQSVLRTVLFTCAVMSALAKYGSEF
jgi:hypothetical protein